MSRKVPWQRKVFIAMVSVLSSFLIMGKIWLLDLISQAEIYVSLHYVLFALLFINLLVLWAKMRATSRAEKALLQVEETLECVSAQEAIMRQVAENASDGLIYQDMDERIVWANPAYCRTMGYELSEIVGLRPREFCFPEELKDTAITDEACRVDPENPDFERLVRRMNARRDGTKFWHEFNLALVEPVPGEQRIVVSSRDVTTQVTREEELERAKADLQHSANHDALTGLNNRTAFLRAANACLLSEVEDERQIGLMYIDLDRFKAVNDTHGHAAGDLLLCHVADAIRASLSPKDLACRMGGDEFVVACPDISDFDTMQNAADALLERIGTPVTWDDTTLICEASIGIALSGGAAMSAEDLLRSADFALYEAKELGAPPIARYDAELHNRQEAENCLVEEFIETLDTNGIDFMFQPIIDARTQKIRSFEALARWTRKNGEVVGPDVFLQHAARLNRICDIDFAAIKATASLTAEIRASGYPIRGAFNTSSEALAHPDFLTHLEHEVKAAGLPTEALVAEVLETTFFGADTADSAAAARINELRRLGYSVYLDDFGVGYAGLAHLNQLDVSGVKLDRSLIANVAHDSSARIISTSILRLCDELGVGTLAEGIETAEQAEFMVAHGCYRLQGFGFARPMSRTALVDLVTTDQPISISAPGDAIALVAENTSAPGLKRASA